jgi:hypothetical protein
VSPRQLSFVETGRARPSPELLLSLSRTLEVPLREQNTLLLAAGYAPRHRSTPLAAPAMARIHATLQRMLDLHDPYPGVVIDRMWNVVLANGAARALVAQLPSHVTGTVLNVYRACLLPDGLAGVTLNFDEWATYLLGQLDCTVTSTGDADLWALRDEVRSYPDVARLLAEARGVEHDELAVELFFPADDATEATLRKAAAR